MRRLIGILAVIALMSAPAIAAMGVKITRPGGYDNYGGGGVFQAEVQNSGIYVDPILNHNPGSKFLTFCLEKDEYIDLNSWYVVGLSNAANAGGSGGPSPDPLSAAAAGLYLEYLGLSSANQMALGDDYQRAIWILEQEEGGSTALTTYATGKWGTGDYAGGQVRVMNLTDASGNLKQDMLVAVPTPGAAVLCFLGLGLVGWVKRRLA